MGEGKLVINLGSIKLTRSRAALQGVSGSYHCVHVFPNHH